MASAIGHSPDYSKLIEAGIAWVHSASQNYPRNWNAPNLGMEATAELALFLGFSTVFFPLVLIIPSIKVLLVSHKNLPQLESLYTH